MSTLKQEKDTVTLAELPRSGDGFFMMNEFQRKQIANTLKAERWGSLNLQLFGPGFLDEEGIPLTPNDIVELFPEMKIRVKAD